MIRLNSFPATALGIILFLFIGFNGEQSQADVPKNWKQEAEPRIRAIYERGEYNGKKFDSEWLPNSSGYITREKRPQDNQPVEYLYDVQSGERTEVDTNKAGKSDRDPLRSPDGKNILEFRKRQLFARNLTSNQRTQLTKRPEDREIWYRQPVWSPDGKRVLFIESDETDVKLRPTLEPTDPSYPEVRNRRFARVGETIANLRVGVVDLAGSDIQWLPIVVPAEGFYLGQVDWAGNSEEVLVETFSRFRDKREFLLVDLNSSEVKSLYQESNEAWAIGSQQTSSGLIWIRDGQNFIVITEKDGWRHAYLYSRDGQEVALLTPGEYDIIERAVVDQSEEWFYIYASPENATQKYLYRVPLDGSGTLERVTPNDQPGTHKYEFSPNTKWAFHTWSTFDSPPQVELVELPDHRHVRVLEDNRELREKATKIITQPTEFLQLDIEDGITLDAWMIKPRGFDPTKKYPVFVYVYSEPYSQTVLDEWGAGQSHFNRVGADQGYLVVSIDSRGTPSPKGAAWRRSIFGSLGPISTEEQAAGLKELGRIRPFVDLSRVGIWGWSGGGSNTLNAMFRKPELYDVGIAVVPKPQPHLYNAWFQEIYMRTREVNPEGYERSAPINFAEGLQGKLLIMTGSGETNTHIQIIEGLVDRLIELGKPFDYMVYPNRDHGLREGKGTQTHVRMLILRYLLENLPSGPQ
ncbi:S9 family peptidase [Rubinisphaera italica]|uniref:Prolyl tripeptidyl peptidase n=1 Tax=Rubinisphaera italica TaxID=2527969 RepID=A0A5C5XF82_9PLAN|nr:DPP IV N-terminal domain-containing protein [Rubinisphaera italica]TWT60542.1 Prolyl tripeptidyl peptidase precursor [Rubinisphaera italica]